MQIIGFNFTKMSVERVPDFKPGPINTSIEIIDVQKDEIKLLKDTQAMRLTFKYSITYDEKGKGNEKEKKADKNDKPSAEVNFEGNIILSINKEELKNIQKSWKKKQLPPMMQIPLYNVILRKCSPRAAYLEEEINLPTHLPIPQLKPSNQQP